MEAETTSRAASLLMSGWESSAASNGAGSSVWGWSRVVAPALHEGAHAPPCQRSLHVAAVLKDKARGGRRRSARARARALRTPTHVC